MRAWWERSDQDPLDPPPPDRPPDERLLKLRDPPELPELLVDRVGCGSVMWRSLRWPQAPFWQVVTTSAVPDEE